VFIIAVCGRLITPSAYQMVDVPMNLDEYTKERLWQLLIEAVHASVMYPTHKAYTRDSILPQQVDVSAVELAERLGLPLGEAIVILNELQPERRLSA
jgi:hypothetical protein